MKWFALILVLLNGIYWLYESSLPVERPQNSPSPAGAARLIMMEELNFDELASLRLDREENGGASVSPAEVEGDDPYDLIRQPLDGEQIAPTVSALGGQCYLFDGPEQVLGRMAERFESLDIENVLVDEVTESPGPMMVYVPPFETAREAAVEVSVLRSEGIDSFIIPDGELARGISVGVFGSEVNAATRMAQLEGLGYQAKIYQYSLEEVTTRLVVGAVSAEVLAEEFWIGLAADFPEQTRTQISCIEVASQHNFQ